MSDQQRALVIGAGIAGLGTAYYLQKAGFRVTVLDKGDGKDNCSYGNAGMIVPSHIIPLASPGVVGKGIKWMLKAESPFYIKPRLDRNLLSWGWKFKQASTRKHVEASAPVLRDLLLANRQLLLELEQAEGLEIGFQKNGLFMLCKTEKGLEEEIELAQKANDVGIPARVLSAEETRAMEPGIEMDIVGATYFPKDAHFHPGSFMGQITERLQQKNVDFLYGTKVTGFQIKERRAEGVVTADGELVEGSHIIICTGAWTPELVRTMNLSLPMQAGKGYSITLKNPKRVPEICALLSEKKVSMTPMCGMLRFGGTMEIAGTETSINTVKLEALKKSACSYFPEYSMSDFEGQDVWVGLRPVSPDGLPYVGKVERYENIYTSTGHSMMGMSLGLVSGNIISRLIIDGQSELSHPLIDPNRYG